MLLAAGCGKRPNPNAAGPSMPPAAVTAVAAIARDVPVYIDEIGKSNASESVTIQPQVSGKIISRNFVDGAMVHAGQLLFEIDPRPFQAALAQAEGQLAKDQATKTGADWTVIQDQSAVASKAISEQQLRNDVALRDEAVGLVAVDQAMIQTAKLNLEYCSITSPLDGRAGARLVDVGNVVNASGMVAGTNLLVINRVDPIYADFTVTEAELQRVRHYMDQGTLQVHVETPQDAGAGSVPASTQPTAAPGGAPSQSMATGLPPTTGPSPFQPREGKLIFLDNAVQDSSGTVKLRAELPNADNHFWPGQFVNIRLVLTVQKSAVLVPSTATQVSQQGLFVYTVGSDDKSPTKQAAYFRMVKVGQQQGDMVVIENGLNAGEQVVTTGQMMLMPGAAVMVVNAPHPPAGKPAAPAAKPQEEPVTMSNPSGGGQTSDKSSQAGGRS